MGTTTRPTALDAFRQARRTFLAGDRVDMQALARELAGNDWQERGVNRRGNRQDRNVELLVQAPAFLG